LFAVAIVIAIVAAIAIAEVVAIETQVTPMRRRRIFFQFDRNRRLWGIEEENQAESG